MPSYLSHAIMGKDVYKKASKEKLFYTDVTEEDMKTFSLGTDLSFFSKISAIKSHNESTKDFFINMIEYIRENKLIEDARVMALLYGHICHYYMDTACHPLIYYNEGEYNSLSFLSNHNLIEAYISIYLCNRILDKDYMRVKSSFFNRGKLNYKKNIELLNYVYQKTYKDNSIMFSSNTALSLLTMLENAMKCGILKFGDLVKIVNLDDYLRGNHMQSREVLNLDNDVWRNPVSGEKHHENILELYNLSVRKALESIEYVNHYLYGNMGFTDLEKHFEDLSYDTGLKCELGREMVYKRHIK